ncbi:Coenzyme Q-binding protein coq10, mitochondrial [Sporothrix epigloea]|uniref:Coenzyme Q-binding protein coq10, mitochondrial n=1 Tax=Sporothrix epigloea TaxID=1892477 RepID=A0ABP0DLY1_9PEZI
MALKFQRVGPNMWLVSCGVVHFSFQGSSAKVLLLDVALNGVRKVLERARHRPNRFKTQYSSTIQRGRLDRFALPALPPPRRSFPPNQITVSTAALPRINSRVDISGRRSIFSQVAAALNQASIDSGGSQQSITTSRTLPYAAADLFNIISDVDAYEQFLPHCTSSRVTHWRSNRPVTTAGSSTQAKISRWPARADLTVGWGPLSQSYSSRVYCVPGHGVVEAVSGRAGLPTLTAAERAEIGLDAGEDDAGRRLGMQTATGDDTFESLVTRWTVSPLPASRMPGQSTRVELQILFQFRNPLYQIATSQISKEMVTKMVDKFEARAAALLGPSGGAFNMAR